MTPTGRIVPTYFLVCYAFHALLSDRTKKSPVNRLKSQFMGLRLVKNLLIDRQGIDWVEGGGVPGRQPSR